MRRAISILLFLAIGLFVSAQQAYTIKGTVIDKRTRRPIELINVVVRGLNQGSVTNSNGEFKISPISPGIYTLQASAIGYNTQTTPEYILSTKDLHLTIEMEESLTALEGVTVSANTFRRKAESPVGLRIIGLQEIEKSPGANRDISRIVQSYPGVAFSPVSYRNDLLVRGGAPSENRFYIDEIEIPNINHFSTQGASGGPVGIINADLIREVNFYSGSFPANRGNALSAVLDFKLRDGDQERHSIKGSLGASEVSLASNGPIGQRTTYTASLRQSYLQFLFKLFNLPFLPTFTDGQFKIKTKLNAHHEITVLGLGAIDRMRLNNKANDENGEYILSYLPQIEQETFTLGTVYRHYSDTHIQSVVLSHSFLNNRNTKYRNNDESNEENLMLRYRSTEQESKFRFENQTNLSNFKIQTGVNLEWGSYENLTIQKRYTEVGLTENYETSIHLWKWGAFGTVSYESNDERFMASAGVRADANNYASALKNPMRQLSPRLSLSYLLSDRWAVSGNTGVYYQLPPYTALGFKDQSGALANKALKYLEVSQASLGISWQPQANSKLTLESFYKHYDNMPFSITDGIPLAGKGNDYGVVGNEALTSDARGRSYGVELLFKWIMPQKFNVASSLTLFRSEFKTASKTYFPSAWDNRYIFNLNGTYNLPRSWSIGLKLSSIGGAPYTPYDEEKSSLVSAWNAQGRPYLDYSRYNASRLSSFTQLDVRIDKTYHLKSAMVGFYMDIQNVTKSVLKSPDTPISTGEIANPSAPANEQRYRMKMIKQEDGTIIPTIGITVEF